MWRLFNNSNQVLITLSIFGVVLTLFVQYFLLPSWIPRVPEVFVLGADFSVSAAGTGGEWSNESKIENHLITMAQEGHSPVLVFDSPVMVYTVQLWFYTV